MTRIYALKLLGISDSSLIESIFNKLSTKKNSTSITKYKSSIVSSIFLNYKINERKSIGKNKLTKSILFEVSDKIIDSI